MFIRTKDRIYEYDDINEKNLNSNVIDIYNCLGLETQIRKCDILKQSDNLDDLCDGYYVQIDDWNFDKTHLFNNLEDAIKDFEDWKSYSDRKYLAYEIFIYGFIKTDKGLIYVAKMNDNGELVLICS